MPCSDSNCVSLFFLRSDNTEKNEGTAFFYLRFLNNGFPFPAVFAFPVSRWIYGNSSLQILFEKEGYILERIDETYDKDTLPKIPGGECVTAMIESGKTIGGSSGGGRWTGLQPFSFLSAMALFVLSM